MYKHTVSMLGATLFLSIALPATAASLYFDKVSVQTRSEATCFQFASDTARFENLRNVHQIDSKLPVKRITRTFRSHALAATANPQLQSS